MQLGEAENLSNRNIGSARGNAVKTAKAAARAADLAPVIEEMRAAGTVSLRGMAEGADRACHPSAAGGKWSAMAVARVLGRAEAE